MFGIPQFSSNGQVFSDYSLSSFFQGALGTKYRLDLIAFLYGHKYLRGAL